MNPQYHHPADDLAHARGDPGTHDLLSDVYALLTELCASAETDEAYRMALQTVLDAAYTSDLGGLRLTMLPLLICQASNGVADKVVPIAAAWRALHIAAKLLDDVQDGDVVRMSSSSLDLGRVINLSTGFITMANLAIVRAEPAVCPMLQVMFSRTILQMAGGQYRELQLNASASLDQYFQIIAAKSGSFFALAAWSGACGAGAEPDQIALYERFGYNLGMLIQIMDDLEGFRCSVGQGDLAQGHLTLPFIYALEVASTPERARLEQLLHSAVVDVEAEVQLRHLLTVLGAEAYLLAEMAVYRAQALAVLDALHSNGSATKLLEEWFVTLQLWMKQH